MKKKFLALVMTLSMVLSLVPMTALAAEGGSTEQPLMTAEGQTEDAATNGDNQKGRFHHWRCCDRRRNDEKKSDCRWC